MSTLSQTLIEQIEKIDNQLKACDVNDPSFQAMQTKRVSLVKQLNEATKLQNENLLIG